MVFAPTEKVNLPASTDDQIRLADTAVTFPIRTLRQPVALNLFKRFIFGERHVAGDPQTELVFDALARANMIDSLDPRTWDAWFSQNPPRLQPGSAKVLDQYANRAIRFVPFEGAVSAKLPADFFLTLVHGGIAQSLLGRTTAKRIHDALWERSRSYVPLSAWHIHMDSVEAAALAEGSADVPWTFVKALAAQRTLDILHVLWGPRHGVIYSCLPSELRLQWNAAQPIERERIRRVYSDPRPDTFEDDLRRPARPNWESIPLRGDVRPADVYKTLFSLAADPTFLVGERLAAWSMDLASAALAMRALAWTDQYATFGARPGPEACFSAAFDGLLFQSPDIDDGINSKEAELRDLLEVTMRYAGMDPGEASVAVLLRAQITYQTELAELGSDVESVLHLAERGERMHPTVFTGIQRATP